MRASSGPDIIYVNVGAINSNSNTDTLASPPRIAQFTETRSVPILEDASAWDYSIIRFNLDGCGALLPLWIPQIVTGQSDINLTVYQVQIGGPPAITAPHAATSAVFETCFPTYPAPAAPLVQQDITNLQYYAKSYKQFTHMINNALDANFVGLDGLAAPPKLSFANNVFSWELGPEFTGHEPTFWLSVNAPLAALLSGFDWRYNIRTPTNNDNLLPNFYTLNIEETDGVGMTVIPQDFPSIDNGLWAPIDGFSFITNFVPVNPEQGTAATQIGVSNLGTQGAITSYAFSNILTDYNVSGFPQDALNAIEYVPSAEYRMGNLAGHSSIQALDVQVYWRYRLTGQLVNLYLPNNASIGLKIMFRRRR